MPFCFYAAKIRKKFGKTEQYSIIFVFALCADPFNTYFCKTSVIFRLQTACTTPEVIKESNRNAAKTDTKATVKTRGTDK